MKQKVDTKQITELADGMRRLDLVIEDAGMIRMNEISKLVRILIEGTGNMIDLDWFRAIQGFFFGGGYPVPNEPIIQPIIHLTHVIPV